jgi:TatA/E family protein of Tat protein translocase
MPFGIGHWELVVLVVVVLLLFGSSQFPKVARQLGKGVRQAGREVAEVKTAFTVEARDDDEPEKS